MARWRRVAVLVTLLGLVGAPAPCRAADAGTDAVADAIQQAVVRIRHGNRPSAGGESISSTLLLPAFYEDRQFQPAWTPSALDSLLEAIRASALDGLEPGDYHLEALVPARATLAAADPPPAARAAADLVATDALIRLGYHARFGKVDQQRIFGNWNFTGPLTDADPLAVMQQAIASSKVAEAIESLYPQHPFYRALKTALARYREIGVAGGWAPIAGGPTLKPGGSDPRVPAVRRRLAIEGYLAQDAAADASPQYDPALADAVSGFQTRHGLAADGSIGAGTLAALNVPVGARIDQLRINLDRARAVMHDLPRRFVVVNVAGFTVYVVDGDWPVWDSRVVVGKPFTETPIFRAKMTYVVLNPTWTVPPGIMAKEIRPGLRRDPNYLAKKGLEWQNGQVVQPAGPKNALGRIKLIFPNPYHVYLHDTPSRALFERSERTFSHGCIRVQKPVELGVQALDDPAWSAQALEAAIATGRTQTVSLRQPLPVLVLYWTATVGESGTLYLLDDPYKRDPATLAALDAPFTFRDRRALLPARMDSGSSTTPTTPEDADAPDAE